MNMKSFESLSIINKIDLPQLLSEIPDPPARLHLRGEVPNWENLFLTVVGSRRASEYGRSACEKLIGGLSGYPITIVSGLAFGIDSLAHRAALSAGLQTVAIPGSGLNWDVLYPRVAVPLARKIVENGGALLSEYEPNFRATPWAFPRRNRLMAGISHAVLIIEAERQSGTLITARLAIDYNRNVLTVPGPIFSSGSEGVHMLLRLGATPIRTSADILEALGLESKKESKRSLRDCSPEELRVIDLLSEPMQRDELVKQLEIGISEGNSLLSLMEIKGLIEEKLGEFRLR